jgi:hypothetical protein
MNNWGTIENVTASLEYICEQFPIEFLNSDSERVFLVCNGQLVVWKDELNDWQSIAPVTCQNNAKVLFVNDTVWIGCILWDSDGYRYSITTVVSTDAHV